MCIATLMDAQTVVSKKCSTCGKPLSQCQYKGRHPNSASPKRHVNVASGSNKGHDWVDLGLPSGTKWATMNVGANSPSDYGSYFAWGETSPKSSYDWGNLKYCLDASGSKFSKYVADSKYGNVDSKTNLELSDDAAYVNWGSGWRMPSRAQQDELLEKCKWTRTSIGGHHGYKVVGPNGNSIFFPYAGYYFKNSRPFVDWGYYWSCSLVPSSCGSAYVLSFGLDFFEHGSCNDREFGHPVRAVYSPTSL